MRKVLPHTEDRDWENGRYHRHARWKARDVGRLDPIFKGAGGSKQTQIVQERVDHLIVKMLRGKDFEPHMSQAVIDELKKRVGQSVKVELVYVDQIERSFTGKFRFVLSRGTLGLMPLLL